MIEIFEGTKKVAEIPESEFWALSGPEKRAFIEATEMTGRHFGFDINSEMSHASPCVLERGPERV